MVANQQLTKTYANLVESRPVLDQVARNLRVDLDLLQRNVNASVVRDTQLIQIVVTHRDPAVAASVGNEIARVFSDQVRDAQGVQLATFEKDLDSEIKSLQAGVDAGTAEVARLEGRPAGLPEDQRLNLLGQATSRLELQRANLLSLQRQYQELKISQARSFSSVRLVDPAFPPDTPVRPRPLFNAGVAAIIGLIAAAGLVVVFEYLDDTVKSAADVTRAVGAATLGAITRFQHSSGKQANRRRHGAAQRLLAGVDNQSAVAEAYRMIRTNLEFARSGRPNKTMLITSASPGEGKTTTASNIAVVLAQTGQRVILVDADMRRPSLHRMFETPNTAGLSTLFVMDTPVIDGFLRDVGVEGLSLLPSGPLPPNPSELLASGRMGRIMDLLRAEADIVICDSPPLLGVADASTLAGQVDGVLLVVDSGRTRRGALNHAADALQRAQATLWGVVLNKISTRSTDGYYYGYRYYGSRDGAPTMDQAALNGAGPISTTAWAIRRHDDGGPA